MARLRQRTLTIFLLLGGLFCPLLSYAVDTAPRISDREIIESLAELKAGQKGLQQQIDQLRQEMNQRFVDVNQRFDDLNRSVNDRFAGMNQRFDDMNRRIDGRFDDINHRLDDLMALLQILIGVLVAIVGGILTWLVVIWRRLARLEAYDNDIKFLKEGFNHLQQMVTQLIAKLP